MLVDGAAGGLLGRHVGERADHVAGACERVLPAQVRNAEVRQLRGPASRAGRVGHDHVLRLDVAVDHAPLVGVGERVGQRQPIRSTSRSDSSPAASSCASVRPSTSSDTR